MDNTFAKHEGYRNSNHPEFPGRFFPIESSLLRLARKGRSKRAVVEVRNDARGSYFVQPRAPWEEELPEEEIQRHMDNFLHDNAQPVPELRAKMLKGSTTELNEGEMVIFLKHWYEYLISKGVNLEVEE